MKSEGRQVVGPGRSWEEVVEGGLHQTIQISFQKINKNVIPKKSLTKYGLILASLSSMAK